MLKFVRAIRCDQVEHLYTRMRLHLAIAVPWSGRSLRPSPRLGNPNPSGPVLTADGALA